MRLPSEFYRLPLRFDAALMQREVEALPESAWCAHPNDYEGNTSVRLISVDGGENDDVTGPMRPTAHLAQCPYLSQVLATFGVVWSRSRLMRLAPRATVPEHADINYHWFNRVRVHIPVVTRPEVAFHCGDRSVHMAAGEAWIFDNWRRHRVENPTDTTRVHLVADTSGSAAFWQMVADSTDPRTRPVEVGWRPGQATPLLTEQHNAMPVMPPAEVELLVNDLQHELSLPADTPESRLVLDRFGALLDGFCREWRQVWALHGDTPEGLQLYARLIEMMRGRVAEGGAGIVARTNQVPAVKILEARVLQHALGGRGRTQTGSGGEAARAPGFVRPAASAKPPRFDRPVFIVSAPRSGSTLLFESLSCSPALWTVGGEAHWLTESFAALCPGADGVDSNRLTAAHGSAELDEQIRGLLAANLRTAASAPWRGESPVRVLEKTPKNALRIPFFNRVFPDAKFIFLWRDPRENIGSIMDGWAAGRWITYPQLDGWDGPWSFLLPPGWRKLRGRPLEEVAAFQWDTTNRVILEDLRQLPAHRWIAAGYDDLVREPRTALEKLCDFAEIEMGAALEARAAQPLPLSRFTLTPPQRDKWRRHEAAILRVMPSVEPTWQALRTLQSPKA